MALDFGSGLFGDRRWIEGEDGNILEVNPGGDINISGSVVFPSAQFVELFKNNIL